MLSFALRLFFYSYVFLLLITWKIIVHWVVHLFQILIYFIKQSKNVFVDITTVFIRKVCKDWEALKLTVAVTSFPKFQFSLKSLNCIIGNKYQLISFEVTRWLLSYLSKYLPMPKYLKKIVCLSVNLSSKNCVSWKEADCSALSSSGQMFFLKKTIIFQYAAEMLFL